MVNKNLLASARPVHDYPFGVADPKVGFAGASPGRRRAVQETHTRATMRFIWATRARYGAAQDSRPAAGNLPVDV